MMSLLIGLSIRILNRLGVVCIGRMIRLLLNFGIIMLRVGLCLIGVMTLRSSVIRLIGRG